MEPLRIFFIRHGETTGDVEDRYGGDYDDHLSEKGVEQSKQLAEQLKDSGIQMVLSSPLIRAKETASDLKDALGDWCVHAVRSEFKERNQYGILTGMVKADAKEKHPEAVEMLTDYKNTIEEAESYDEFSARIKQGFDGLVSQMENSPAKTVAVVWHGGPMRVLFRDVLKMGELNEIGDCAFVQLEKGDDAWIIKSSDRISFGF